MAVHGKELQSYDLEWQWVRAYWGNYVLGETDRWNDPKVGFRLLQLYREYVWRAIVPIRDQNSVLVQTLGVSARDHTKCDTFGDAAYKDVFEDLNDDYRELLSQGQYEVLLQGRSSMVLSELTQTELVDTIRRCYRVYNALSAIKMTKGANDNPELKEEISSTMNKLKRRSTIAQRYIRDDPFPYNPQYVDRFIKENRWWVEQIQQNDPFIGRKHPDNPMERIPWPYYIGITQAPMRALGTIRTELKGRMAIARHRTRNVDDPNKRVVLKRYLAEVVHDVTNVRPKTEEEDSFQGEEHTGDL